MEEGMVKMMNAKKEIPLRYKVPGQSKMRKLSHLTFKKLRKNR